MSAEPTGAPLSATPPRLHPLLRSLLFLLAFFLIRIGVGAAIGAFLRRGAGGVGRSNELLLLAFAATLPPLLLVSWIFVTFLDRRPLATIGLRAPNGGRRALFRQAVRAFLGAAALLGAWLALVLALPDGAARFDLLGLSAGFHHPPGWWHAAPALLLLLLLVAFCLQGWVEEWLVRGYVYHALKERWRPVTSAVLSSLVFALLHAGNPSVSLLSMVNIFLAGMINAGLVERTGSLWSASLAHGGWNFAVACLLSVPVSGFSLFHLLDVRVAGDGLLTGGGFGPEGSLMLTPVALLTTAWIWRGIPRPSGGSTGGPAIDPATASPTAQYSAGSESPSAGSPDSSTDTP